MNQAVAQKQVSEAEYLAFEAKSNVRHEFMDGEMFVMAGATRKHNLLSTNISRALGNALEKTDCEVYASDFRVKIREGHNVYPDVAVACSEILTENNETTLLNPTIVFEVLSKSTEKRDRGDKAEDYFRLKTLTDYVLVSQYRLRVEHFSRQKNNVWTLNIYEDLRDVIDLKSTGAKISLELVFLKLKMPPLKLFKERKTNGNKRR